MELALRFLRFAILAAGIALPGSALALTSGNVAVGDVLVSTTGTATGTVNRGAADETLAMFDTSACTGITITPDEALPKTFTTENATLGFTVALTPAARASYNCTITLRAMDNSNLGMFQVTGQGVAPVLMVDTNALTFGEVKLTGATAARTLTITNGGDAGTTLTVSALTRGGAFPGDYSTSPATPYSLAAGASRTVTVTFDPSDLGARAASLTVESNDPIEATEVVTLTGTGVNPVISTPNDYNFGVVTVGTAEYVDVAVANSGTGTLTVQSAAITAVSGSWFTFYNAPDPDCDNLTSCDFAPDLAIAATPAMVSIRCMPPAGASGTQTRTLTFTSDSAAGGDSTVTLTCTAGRPDISAAPTSLTFGNVELGAMATPQGLVVTNTGTEDLSITSATLTGPMANQFMVTAGQAGAQTLMPGMMANWMITCAPNVEGVITGTAFSIVSNAVNSPTLNIPLACTGGRLTSNQTTFDFGQVRAGDSSTLTFTLRNTGSATISNFVAVFNAPADAAYTVEGLPTSLAAGATDTVTVRFSPTDTTSGTQAGETHTFRIEGTHTGGTITRTRNMTLLGDGLSVGYIFDPGTLDIGGVRWDQTRVGSVMIRNIYEAPVRLTSATLTVNTGTATSELVRTDSAGNTPAPAFSNIDLMPGQSTTVYFRADPNNRLGAMAATFTVNSNLGVSQMPTRALQVTATSTTPAITADPPTQAYDFGPTDVDAGMVSKILTLTNSGQADLQITSAAISGTGSRYTVVATTPATIAPGAAFTATVRYDPTAVATDTGTLVVGVGGIFGGTMTSNFALAGRGIDRVFAVTPPGLFPETYRNPGSEAPVQDVVVRNNGEAPLRISATMVTGEPIWSLVNPDPVTIAPSQTHAFQVRFAPQSGGKAPTGQLILTHDDNDRGGIATIELNGFGKNPMLSVAPAEVLSLGTTAVGFPVRLSDTYPAQLTVQNNDQKAFQIRELKLVSTEDESEFSLSDELAGATLAPGETRRFDIVFAASKVGEFQAQLQIFVDEDTTPATIVQLMGTAVEVEVSGGGGCQSAGGGTWLLALLLACGLLVRRRAAAAGALGATLALSTGAQAQISRELDLSLFRPQSSTTGELLHVQAPTAGQTGEWTLGLGISHLVRPLEVSDSMGETSSPVAQRTVFELGAAAAIGGRVELGGRVAMMRQLAEESEVGGLSGGEGAAFGDALLHAKVRLLGGAQGASVGVAAAVTLPTATESSYAGPGSVTASGQLLAAHASRRFFAGANVGFGYQDKVLLGSMTQGNRVLFGAGVSWRASDKLRVSGELFGAAGIGQRDAGAATPVEALLGLRYRLARTVGVSLGLGRGVLRGVGAPAMHGVLAFELMPQATAVEPLRPPAPYVPPPDQDGDQLADAEDHCPAEAEDQDGFADRDGCPDPDNDFDSVADAADKCPLEREDKDGVDDADGCPDLDDDGDQVVGAADKCPKVAEDRDAFEDGDGCPDPDDDQDGILDAADKCPRQPETINDVDNQDGCPDSGFAAVLVAAERFELMMPVSFVGQTAKLSPSSLPVLEQVAATLRANPGIARIRIGVHVHPRGRQDQDLTDRRAAAVRDFLVQWGIPTGRLDARGFGSEKLIMSAQRKNAAQLNDRVEFTIMERK